MPASMPAAVKTIQHPGTYPKPAAPAAVVMIDVWSPEGVKKTLTQLNARDYVRSRGYTLQSPVQDAPATAEGTDYSSPPICGTGAAPNPALDALNDLRKRAEALGVTVDNRWGTRRLNEEIATAEANVDKGA